MIGLSLENCTHTQSKRCALSACQVCESHVMFPAISYYPTLNWSFIKKGPMGTRSSGLRFRSLPTYHQAF